MCEIKINKLKKQEVCCAAKWFNSLEKSEKNSLNFKFEEDTFFTLKLDHRIVGIMSVRVEKEAYADLRRFIKKEYRGAGLADMMLRYLIYNAKIKGIKKIEATLNSSNSKGIGYFESMKFDLLEAGVVDGISLSLATLIIE